MKPIFTTPDDFHYFWGYYDKSQLDKNGEILLAQRTKMIDHLATKDDILEIGYFRWKNSNEFIKVAETRAWNWQQGCMLQWLGPEYKDRIIFNDCLDGKFISRIIDLNSGEEQNLPMPIYTVHPSGKYALCVDHERHHWFRRGYSYDGVYNQNKRVPISDEDGIWLMNLESRTTKRIITLAQMINHRTISNMKGGAHYLEHLMFSPSGERFLFLHRWRTADGGIYARFYSSAMNGEDIFLLNDSGRMSHYCWIDDKTPFGWGGISNPINSLRKYKSVVKLFLKPLLPLYKKIVQGDSVQGQNTISSLVTGDSYILFEDKKNNKRKIPISVINCDGHPSANINRPHKVITDTYPGKSSRPKLMLLDLSDNSVEIIDELSSMSEHDESATRCDLHPRWSYDGNYVTIDTMDKGRRSIYLYEIR